MPHTFLRSMFPGAVALALAATLLSGAPAAAANPPGTLGGPVWVGLDPAQAGEVRVEYTAIGSSLDPDDFVLTGADGRYLITGLSPGSYQLQFVYLGTRTDMVDRWYQSNGYATTQADAAAVPYDHPYDLEAVLVPRRDVEVQISLGDSSVAPPSGEVTVEYRTTGLSAGTTGYSDWSTTFAPDAAGRVTLPSVTPSAGIEYRIVYSGAGPFQRVTTRVENGFQRMNSPAGGTFTIPAQRVFSGQVTLGTTSRVAAAGEVQIIPETYLGVAAPLESPVYTDADGRFAVTVDPAYSQLRFRYLGSEGFRSEIATNYPQNPTVTANVTIPVGYQLSGTALLGAAATAPGAGAVQVTAVSYFGERTSAMVGADGAWQIRGLPSGSYRLEFQHLGDTSYPTWYRGSAAGIGTMSPGTIAWIAVSANISGLDVVVGGGAEISGTARDSSGTPISGVTISLLGYRITGPNEGAVADAREATTGPDGRFVFRALARPAAYLVSFEGNDEFAPVAWSASSIYYEPELIVIQSPDAVETADLELLRSGTISGTVTGAVRPGVTDVEVLVPDGSGSWFETGDFYEIAPDRTFSIAGLAPDDYRLRVGAPDRTGFRDSPTLVLGEGESIAWDVVLSDGFERDQSADGVPDVLVRSLNGTLYRYTGSGVGTFGPSTALGVGWNYMNAIFPAGDFDGDGQPDLIARDPAGALWLFRGTVAGAWRPALKIGVGWNAFDRIFSPGDFDGDGHPDVIARTPSGALYLYRGDGAGGWSGSRAIGSGWNGFNSVFGVGDFDGDANVDVMARTPGGQLYLYRGNGQGGWLGGSAIGSGWNGFDAVLGAGDFSGDGNPDVMARTPGGVLYLYRGSGTGGWAGSAKIGIGWNTLYFLQ